MDSRFDEGDGIEGWLGTILPNRIRRSASDGCNAASMLLVASLSSSSLPAPRLRGPRVGVRQTEVSDAPVLAEVRHQRANDVREQQRRQRCCRRRFVRGVGRSAPPARPSIPCCFGGGEAGPFLVRLPQFLLGPGRLVLRFRCTLPESPRAWTSGTARRRGPCRRNPGCRRP